MPIDWKATRQRSVTTSTTEAELIALLVTGGEMEWWIRVFNYVKFNPEIQLIIYGNNEQTVEIVKKEDERLHTKLRHVDTHQMWVRQLGLENVHQLLTAQVNTPEPAELQHWY
jgi:hypothetical protein